MKPSIAFPALLASFLACSHGIEQQVRRRELAASDNFFHKIPERMLQSYGGGNQTITQTPTPAPNQCIACGDPDVPFDLVGMKNSLEESSNAFIAEFTANVLDPSICEPDNLPTCLKLLEDQRASLNAYSELMRTTIRELDSLICKGNIIGLITPECPFNGLEGPGAFFSNSGRRLEPTQVSGIEGEVLQSEGEPTDTMKIQLDLIQAKGVVDGIEKTLNGVPECGDPACAAFATIAKAAAAVALGTAAVAFSDKEYYLAGVENKNDDLKFEYTKTNQHNMIEAHKKLDAIKKNVNDVKEEVEQIKEEVDQIKEEVDQIKEEVDRLLCPFGPTPGALFTVLGQGCDSTDQNCDKVTDECAEDNVPPSIMLKVPPPAIKFKSTDDALQFLLQNVVVSDDCAVQFQTDFQLLSELNCCDCQFEVTTADVRCVDENDPGMATASRVFILKVDSSAPIIKCGFFTQQDPFHVKGGFDPCGSLPVPFPGENDTLHIDQACVGEGLFDVALWYQIEDECDEGVLPVTVRVLSNEFSEEKMTLIVERNDLPNMVHRAQVYLSPTSCKEDNYSRSKASSRNGRSTNPICEIEETDNDSVSTRFYDITISAIDAAGNVGNKTCSVAVIPEDHYCGVGDREEGPISNKKCGGKKSATVIQNGGVPGVRRPASLDEGLLNNEHNPDDLRMEYANSTQRYVISEFLLEWDPKLNTTLAVPSLPGKVTDAGTGKRSKTGDGTKSGQRSCPVSCEGGNGKKGKKKVIGV